MGKVIFLDIDGTIRDFDGTVQESAVEAIRKARRNGHEVFLNTGRLYCRIEKKIRDIGFDGVIASSGGYIEYKGERIAHKYFTQLAYIELMKDLLEQRCVVEMGNNKGGYVFQENWMGIELGGLLQDLYRLVREAVRGRIRGFDVSSGRVAAGGAGCGTVDRFQSG